MDWICDVLGLMSIHNIKKMDIANKLGFSQQYISQVFNRHKSPKGIEQKIRYAIDEIVSEGQVEK